MSFDVRTDVPMPGARNRYPFETMAAGAMFEIVGVVESRKVRNAAYQFQKKVNKQAALKQAAESVGRPLSSEEKAAVAPLEKGDDGAIDFALRKLHTNAAGEVVFGLWRTA